MRQFNTAGKCIPAKHYMVDISRQVDAAASLVAQGKYFCINRGRQFGKTTTLSLLKKKLEEEGYTVFSISFEGLGDTVFGSLDKLLYATVRIIGEKLEWGGIQNITDTSVKLLQGLMASGREAMSVDSASFSSTIARISLTDRAVMLIDEVDQAGNYPVFIQFLGLLRNMFLNSDEIPTFQSVILAGVYDVKNLKLKMRSDDQHQYNSPWNIAVAFDIDMALPAEGIAGMLREYKADHALVFDEPYIGQMIYDYTSGYPFLVSRICEIIDTNSYPWDKEGVLKAVHDLLLERNTLFDDMIKKLDEYPKLKDTMKHILYGGVRYAYNPDEKYMQIALMFNFVKVTGSTLSIMCRLMETRLYNYFLSEEKQTTFYLQGDMDKSQFVHDGYIDMLHLIERFCIHFNEIYSLKQDDRFVEENGRKIFLTYLRPIINGIGNYYCEARTRDLTRTDIIVDYLGKQYVVELKIWRGDAYNERGENQLAEYLDFYKLDTGYLVSFCFNKNKKIGVKDVLVGDRKIYEAIV